MLSIHLSWFFQVWACKTCEASRDWVEIAPFHASFCFREKLLWWLWILVFELVKQLWSYLTSYGQVDLVLPFYCSFYLIIQFDYFLVGLGGWSDFGLIFIFTFILSYFFVISDWFGTTPEQFVGNFFFFFFARGKMLAA